MTMLEVMTAVARFEAAANALAVLGARAALTDTDSVDPKVGAGIDEVLAAGDLPDPAQLPPPQRAMVAGYVRSAFGQAADLLDRSTRSPGWTYTDPVVLEGQGRGSMAMPGLLAQTGEFGDVSSFLDVGTGVGWLAVGAAQVWANCTVVGIDIWEPSLERARANVAAAGLAERIELRRQDITDLDDRDRFDLTWVPIFFVAPDTVAAACKRILTATRAGGQVAVARYDAPSDPLLRATLQLRTIRDGGSWLETDQVIRLLQDAGWSDVHQLAKPLPNSPTFIAGRKR